MNSLIERAMLRAAHCLPAEEAHVLAIAALERGAYLRQRDTADPRLRLTRFGLEFPNPVGIAAGFDKDARAYRAVLELGAGFAEVGTVTPNPQAGNPKPRVFRLPEERAVINRLGFNNEGHAAALSRLSVPHAGIVGVNIGANRDSADRAADYVLGVETFVPVASYLMVNISSPNTPGLRNLQAPAELDALLSRVLEARTRTIECGMPRRPVLVKLAPDLADEDLGEIVAVLVRRGVDGIAVSNTTVSRADVRDRRAGETGGLSGRPLFARSTRMLARIYVATEGRIPLIGIGGIDSAARALEKIAAGASLLQLYTGLVYEGFGLLDRLKQGLVAELDRRGGALDEIVGTQADAWAAKVV